MGGRKDRLPVLSNLSRFDVARNRQFGQVVDGKMIIGPEAGRDRNKS